MSKFRLGDYTKSQTAQRKGIDNTPSHQITRKLRLLHNRVVKQIMEEFDNVVISSGYRCLKLNRAIGSKDSSQHTKGEAVDLEVIGMSNLRLWNWCRRNLSSYDQLILEFHKPGKLQSGWVHISFKSDKENRKNAFKIG